MYIWYKYMYMERMSLGKKSDIKPFYARKLTSIHLIQHNVKTDGKRWVICEHLWSVTLHISPSIPTHTWSRMGVVKEKDGSPAELELMREFTLDSQSSANKERF